MEVKMILSSRGQVVVPKVIREALGLHAGSELFISLREDNVLEITPIHKDIREFFGRGAKLLKSEKMSLSDIDEAIAQAVIDNTKNDTK